MRQFVCTTIKANDYTALTYKSHTIAKYKNGKLTIDSVGGFSPYVLDCLREFIIKECYWVYRALNYPLDSTELKDSLVEGIKNRLILCNNDIYV